MRLFCVLVIQNKVAEMFLSSRLCSRMQFKTTLQDYNVVSKERNVVINPCLTSRAAEYPVRSSRFLCFGFRINKLSDIDFWSF